MSQIYDILIWYGLLELLGLLMIPVVLYFFGNLSDKGYSVAKTLGVLLLTYFAYVLTRHGGFPYDQGIIFISLIFLACMSFALLASSNRGLSALKSRNFWKSVLVIEVIFALSFLLFLSIQVYDPDIDGGEAPMDFSYLNSAVRSSNLPPPYPWYSGKSLESCYYYFGHLAVATLTKLSGMPASLAYNLAICTFMSLLSVSSFGMGFNLTKKYHYGLVAVYFVVFMANMFGLMHVVNTLLPQINIHTPSYEPALYGTFFQRLITGGSSSVFWWSTRVIPWTITEVPWFSFLWSDLHAHFMSHTFFFLVLAFMLSIFNSKKTGFSVFGDTNSEKVLKILLLSLCIGFIFPQFIWIYPIALGFSFLTLAVQQYANSEKFGLRSVLNIFLICGSIAILSFAFFSNIFIELLSPQRSGFAPEVFKTSIYHFLILFLLFLFLIFAYLFYEFSKLSMFRDRKKKIVSYLLPVLFVIILILAIVDFFSRPDAFFSPLAVDTTPMSIIQNFQILLILVPMILLSSIFVFKKNLNKNQQFVSLMIIMGAVIVLFSELWSAQGRYVFIFKVYNPLWIFWAMSSVYIVFYLNAKLKKSKSILKLPYMLLLCFLVIVSSIPYLSIATYAETNGLKFSYGREKPTLDGIDYLSITHKGDYEAIRWINENIKETPVILEAPGKQYTYTSRVSSFTGLPTVIGWEFHAGQVTNIDDLYARIEDVNTLYNTSDIATALKLTKKYNVTYIYVGEIERGPSIIFDPDYIVHLEYSIEGLEKFDKFPEFYELIYNNLDVKIYKVK